MTRGSAATTALDADAPGDDAPTAPSAGRPGLRAVDMTDAPPEAWDALAVRSPRGEVLQSHAWGELKRRGGWEVRRYRIEDRGRPIAVASIQARPLLPARLSGMPGVATAAGRTAGRFLYVPTGPVLLSDPESDRDVLPRVMRALTVLAARRRAALVTVDPIWEERPDLAAALAASGYKAAERQIQVSRTGMVVPVDVDESAQHARIGSSVAWNINRARKKGVVTHRVGADTPADDRDAALEAFDAILEATARRHGLHLRERSYRLDASRAVVESDVASIWFARVDGRDVAATLVHHCGRRLVSFQSGEPDIDKRNRLPANYVLQWDILRWAAVAGFREYDLGGVDTAEAPGIPHDETHPLWGLFQFKLGWGARPVVYIGAYEHAPSKVRGAIVRVTRRFVRAGG
jgi:lipid II:glycine glycyltransferase (peptidoglycan interpeptide bridge formation enzyme)